MVGEDWYLFPVHYIHILPELIFKAGLESLHANEIVLLVSPKMNGSPDFVPRPYSSYRPILMNSTSKI